MNNLYNWHDEWMSELKQREIRTELERIRLLKEAAGSKPGWFEQMKAAVGHVAAAWKQAHHNAQYAHHHGRRSHRGKFAH